jgi:hypothetical protein
LTEWAVKLKKLKVYWSIEGQNTQIQIQWLKWKRRPTSRPTIEFGRDAIELIFKIKIYNWGLESFGGEKQKEKKRDGKERIKKNKDK